MVHKITSDPEFRQEVSSGAVLVDFFATWCKPCQRIAPKIDELEPKYSSVEFLKVDVDEFHGLTEKYEVLFKPTFKFFKDGKVVDTVVGDDLEGVKKALDSLSK